MWRTARNHLENLLSSLRSVVLGVGVISKVVNKAAFDVSLCHDMFEWISVVWLSMDMLISSRMDVVIILQ
jgi:hypothetical protein